MQVSATSRHCEKNGWGGCLRKSENITKQVHQWEEAIESIPLAKLGGDYGNFLLLWLSVSEHQRHLSCLIWTFELLQLWTKCICTVLMSKWPFLTCFTVTPGTIKTGIPHVVASWSPVWYGLKPCFDSRSSSWCQSVDGSCNNGCILYCLFLRP